MVTVSHATDYSDWPVRVFYGLVTLYQGLFGIFSSSTIFHSVLIDHKWGVEVIIILLATGAALLIDGLLSMLMYCTAVTCSPAVRPIASALSVSGRRRPWLFLPPSFCYYLTLLGAQDLGPLQYSYYIMLSLAGVVFCLRDGVISQKTRSAL